MPGGSNIQGRIEVWRWKLELNVGTMTDKRERGGRYDGEKDILCVQDKLEEE